MIVFCIFFCCLQDVIKTLQKDKLDKDKVIDELQHEKKEMDLTISALKTENRRLKMKTIDINKYSEWSTQDLLYWITLTTLVKNTINRL